MIMPSFRSNTSQRSNADSFHEHESNRPLEIFTIGANITLRSTSLLSNSRVTRSSLVWSSFSSFSSESSSKLENKRIDRLIKNERLRQRRAAIANKVPPGLRQRIMLNKVIDNVEQSAEFSVDFFMYTIFAGCLTTAGLMYNDNISIAGAMCIEPVVNTVFAAAFGTCIYDFRLVKMGIINNTLVLIICFIIGYAYGIVGLYWQWSWTNKWPTLAMYSRGIIPDLWYGLLQAFAGGGAGCMALLINDPVRLIGLAIIMNFMTPMTNSGLLIAYVTHISIEGKFQQEQTYNLSGIEYTLKPVYAPINDYQPNFYADMRFECSCLALFSALYTYVNVFMLYVMCIVILKIKEHFPYVHVSECFRRRRQKYSITKL